MARLQNTHVTDRREVLYPWHPWFGRSVYVHYAIDKPGDAVFRCNLTGRRSDRLLEVPIWMFDRAACASCRRSGSAHVGLEAALLHKSGFEHTSPFPRRTYPTGSVRGMPRAV